MKIQEIIQEVDASRRGFLKGAAGIAAASALPSVPAGMVKQLVKEIKPNNVGAVKDLMDRFDIRRLYTIFRSWDDPDMWQPNYMLERGDQEKLWQHYKNDFEKFENDNPPPARATEPAPDDWDEERDGPWEPWGGYQPFGDRRRNPDNYVLYRLLVDNADKIGIDPNSIGKMFEAGNDEGMEQAFDIYTKNWPKLIPSIESIVGHKIDVSDAIKILQKNGIKDPVSFANNEELWEVLEKLYGQSFHNDPWPEGWPSFQDMMKRDNFSITSSGTAVKAPTASASQQAPASAPKTPEQFKSMMRLALNAAASMIKKGKKPDAKSLEVPANLNVTLNKPETEPGKGTATPASLPAPAPGIDLGLGQRTGERVPVGNREKTR